MYLAQGKQLIAMFFYANINLMLETEKPYKTPD